MRKIISVLIVVVYFICSLPVLSFAQPMTPTTENAGETLPDLDVPVSTQGTSSKITLELKGVDILDVLKVLSKKSGLNIVAGKNVRGQVTLFLQDVDVWDALRIVLETSELAYEQKGDIIKVITKSDYEAVHGKPYADTKITKLIPLTYAKAQSVSETLNQLKSNVGRIIVEEPTNSVIVIDTPEAFAEIKEAIKSIDVPMRSQVFHLRYADVEELETKLSELVTPNVGVIKVDKRTNKLVITDIPSKLEQISEIVKAFDEKPRQVLIEAKIVEVSLEDEYVLGIDWNMIFYRSEVSPISYASNSLGGLDIPNTSGPLSGVEGSDLAVFTINATNDDFHAVISALEGMGKTNTLANPRVAVLDNEEAAIAVATRQPFVSQTVVQGDNTSTTADNVEFVDVGVTLSVTPSITEDNYILIDVKPEVSTAGTPLTLTSTDANGEQFTRTVVPVVTSQEVETTVLVKSGSTIILGGLIQDSQVASRKKVPVLGDIPFIGAAFQNKSDDFKKTELVIFITPYILSSDRSSPELDLYLTNEGNLLPFNEAGGIDDDYYTHSKQSQSYLHIDDRPYWDSSADHRGARLRDYSDSINEFGGGSGQGLSQFRPDTGARQPVLTEEYVDDEYLRLLKKRIFDSIINDPSLKGLSGEVRISLVISRNGYLKRVNAYSLSNNLLNNMIILAINNSAPYPPFPFTDSSLEHTLNFTFFF